MIATEMLKTTNRDERVFKVFTSFNARLTTTAIGINMGWAVISWSLAITVTSEANKYLNVFSLVDICPCHYNAVYDPGMVCQLELVDYELPTDRQNVY